jgi:hypothetical protein
VRDTRYQWAYLFGAVCPSRKLGAGLVMPYANTEAMNKHLEEIAKAVLPGAHAVLVLDQAGWHGSQGLIVPANITLLPLPPYSPELNPAENVWEYCARTSSQTAYTGLTKTSSRPAVRPGTTSWPCRSRSPPLPQEAGQKRHDLWRLV